MSRLLDVLLPQFRTNDPAPQGPLRSSARVPRRLRAPGGPARDDGQLPATRLGSQRGPADDGNDPEVRPHRLDEELADHRHVGQRLRDDVGQRVRLGPHVDPIDDRRPHPPGPGGCDPAGHRGRPGRREAAARPRVRQQLRPRRGQHHDRPRAGEYDGHHPATGRVQPGPPRPAVLGHVLRRPDGVGRAEVRQLPLRPE